MNFALFTFARYYPNGGWTDLDSLHTSEAQAIGAVRLAVEAKAKSEGSTDIHFHIVNLRTRKIIWNGYYTIYRVPIPPDFKIFEVKE